MKIINSIKDDLNREPVSTGTVYCKQYWPGTLGGSGGVFQWCEGSTSEVDNGKWFAGVVSTGRWYRVEAATRAMTPQDYGAIADLKFRRLNGVSTNEFEYGGLVYRSDVTITAQATNRLLSSYFSNLGLVNSWYPQARVGSVDTSLNYAAIQSCLEYNATIFIPPGIYWINRPIEYMRHRCIRGAGMSSTVIYGENIAKFSPRRHALPRPDTASTNYQYVYNTTIEGLTLGDNAPDVGGVYNATKSAIYWPSTGVANIGDGNTHSVLFRDIEFFRPHGDGIFLRESFAITFDRVRGEKALGYWADINGGNTTIFRDCYVQPCIKGGVKSSASVALENCNGIDSFLTNNCPMVVVGDSTTIGSLSLNADNCNFEGSSQLIVIYGTESQIKLTGGTLQHRALLASDVGVDFKGYSGSLVIDGLRYFSIGVDTESAVRFLGSNVSYIQIGKSPGAPKFRCVNDDGSNTYGAGAVYDPVILRSAFTDYAKPGLKVARVYSLKTTTTIINTTNYVIPDWQSNYKVDATAGNVTIRVPYNYPGQTLSIARVDNTTNRVNFTLYVGETQIVPNGFTGLVGNSSIRITSIGAAESIISNGW